MNELKISKDLQQYLLYEHCEFTHQYVFRFSDETDTYGASVVHIPGQYGWELAVIYFYGEENHDWSIGYDTDITDDVIQHQTDDEIMKLLRQIKELNE